MAIFNSYVKLPEGTPLKKMFPPGKPPKAPVFFWLNHHRMCGQNMKAWHLITHIRSTMYTINECFRFFKKIFLIKYILYMHLRYLRVYFHCLIHIIYLDTYIGSWNYCVLLIGFIFADLIFVSTWAKQHTFVVWQKGIYVFSRAFICT